MSSLKALVRSNTRKGMRIFVSTLLISSLVTPTFALPGEAFLRGIATLGRTGNFSNYVSGGFLGSIVQNVFPTAIGALLNTDSTAKKTVKKVQFDRIVIAPGNLTVLQGEAVNLVATAYNGEQPVAGVVFTWTVSEADNNKPERKFSNGRLKTNKAGRFLVKASANGRYAETLIIVKVNHGLGLAKLLMKNESDRTEADRETIARLKAKGLLTTREISSRNIYSIAEERALAAADRAPVDEPPPFPASRSNRNG